MNFREMAEADLPFFLKVRNESAEWLHDPRQFSMEECTEWFQSLELCKDMYRPFYQIIEFEGHSIGYFRLKYSTGNDGRTYCVDIGADLAKEFRGRGLAYQAYTELMSTITTKALTIYPEVLFQLEVLGHNITGINLYKKLGFKLEGPSLKLIERNGRLYPSFRMYKWA